MNTRIYLRASTKQQDAERAKYLLVDKAEELGLTIVETYIENYTGTKLKRPVLNQLLEESKAGEVIFVESVDRLSRLSQPDFELLKDQLKAKGLRLIVADLPTTHQVNDGSIAGQVLDCINNMLVDLMATMARLDQEKRVERIKQGQQRAKEMAAAKGVELDKGGRPANTELINKIDSYIKKGLAPREIMQLAGCSSATFYRIKNKLTT
ncbi:recombinase family protein [Pseudoalteromonas sp. KAN5]|uniref:recombinase family protein n=1 Tax=Pseudoalteromonas sp. KAN5 TaxID=2916633 RepID=UPI001FCB19A1|nr:recombinase family protein [Pseudoalteromonas sp. KAN5]BDF96485.1 resolvase [Pseudoalteromonas sp. KAN5]